MTFRDDRDALLARNDALQDELDDTKRELAEAREELEQAQRTQSEAAAQPAPQDEPEPMPDKASREKRRPPRDSKPRPGRRASTNIVWRILSVFGRAWVIVLYGVPAFFAVMYTINAPSSRPTVAAGLAGAAIVVVIIDGLFRRCRWCRRWLGAKRVSQSQISHATRVANWQCYVCGQNWQTRHAVTNDQG